MQEIILHILQDLGLKPEPSCDRVISRIEQYLQLLVKWNRKINLTAERDPEEILKKHVFDSLQYSKAIEPGFKVMDIGSGAGFPGIPLKIVFSTLQLVLVESQRKRCSFLETALRDLALDGSEVINARAEDIPSDRQFDAVVFRAVSGLQPCFELGERFVAPGGKLVLIKPPKQDPLPPDSGFFLKEELAITGYHGLASSLLVYEKCST